MRIIKTEPIVIVVVNVREIVIQVTVEMMITAAVEEGIEGDLGHIHHGLQEDIVTNEIEIETRKDIAKKIATGSRDPDDIVHEVLLLTRVHAVHEGKKIAILKTKKSGEIRKKSLRLGQRKKLSKKRMMIKKKEARGKKMIRREMIATKIKARIEIEREDVTEATMIAQTNERKRRKLKLGRIH